MESVAPVLHALADPTRRAIVERVRRQPRSVAEIARTLHVSRPAVSQHLRVLQEAQLLKCRKQGRNNFYVIDLTGIIALRSYVESFWDDVLDAFQSAAVQEAERASRKESP